MKTYWPESSIKSLLYRGNDPIEDYLADESSIDMETWNTGDVFKFLIPYLKPSLIIEVGTWKGGSAIDMVTLLNNYGIHSEIVCIDTFCGSEVHWLGHIFTESKEMGTPNDSLYSGLKIKKSRPTLFDIFMNKFIYAF